VVSILATRSRSRTWKLAGVVELSALEYTLLKDGQLHPGLTVLADPFTLRIARSDAQALSDSLQNVCPLRYVPATNADLISVQAMARLIIEQDQDFVRRKTLSKLLVKMTHHFDVLPSALCVQGVEDVSSEAVSCGAFADIYKGVYRGRAVALKRFREFLQGHTSDDVDKVSISDELTNVPPHASQRLRREIFVWQPLDHPNVLPFVGIDGTTFAPRLCMVSPWMPHGSLLDFIQAKNLEAGQINDLVSQVAQSYKLAYDASYASCTTRLKVYTTFTETR
jgi:hypothetical protein